MNAKDVTCRLARWALLLQQYNFDIIHHPGCQNGNADAFRRRPYPNTNLSTLQKSDPKTNEIHEKQEKDPEFGEVMDYIQNDILPNKEAKARKIAFGLVKASSIVSDYQFFNILNLCQSETNTG